MARLAFLSSWSLQPARSPFNAATGPAPQKKVSASIRVSFHPSSLRPINPSFIHPLNLRHQKQHRHDLNLHTSSKSCDIQATSSSVPSSSDVPVEQEMSPILKKVEAFGTVFANLFPVWTVLSAGVALFQPAAFTWLTTAYYTALLAILMTSMGLTLTVEDFKKVMKRFNSVIMQFFLCYGVVPALAYVIGKMLKLPADLLAGLLLVGSVNGGQASNLCTYIAKGNVALSVIMTTATTLGAIVMTPLLSKVAIGAVVPVDAVGMALSTVQVVLFPIAGGMTLKHFFPNLVKNILMPFAPTIGVLATCILVAGSMASCSSAILAAGAALQIACALLHLIGGIIGYWCPRFLGFNETVCRTSAIETAMKSSAFAYLLASLHFSVYTARVPAAVSLLWMALTGSTLGVIWRFIPVKAKARFDRSLVKNRKPKN